MPCFFLLPFNFQAESQLRASASILSLTLIFNYHLFQRQLFAVDFFVCALKFNPHTQKKLRQPNARAYDDDV